MATADDQPDTGPTRHEEDEVLTAGFREARKPYMVRRREKIRDELDRNTRGDYKVPTWVLFVILIVIVVGWVSVIAFA